MSVENDVRPHGPSKVSRRNLIAGAAVAVPAAAVLNASSAWAKPVVNSLIGMPALQASVSYTFLQLFSVLSTGTATFYPKDKKIRPKIVVTGFTIKNKSAEQLTGSISLSLPGYTVTGLSGLAFSLAPGGEQVISFEFQKINPPPGDVSAGTPYSVLFTATVQGQTGPQKITGPQGFVITA